MFDSQSDVTVVLTSCNRLDLLKETLESFFSCNTYPINKFILIEDSGKITSQEIKECIPQPFQELVSIIVNETPLGQLKSIDRAYANIKTKYIFHCEDDWLFYRSGFIEDSKKVLEHDKHILSVWLRDYPYFNLFFVENQDCGRLEVYPWVVWIVCFCCFNVFVVK